jgi:hypothetical protein
MSRRPKSRKPGLEKEEGEQKRRKNEQALKYSSGRTGAMTYTPTHQ